MKKIVLAFLMITALSFQSFVQAEETEKSLYDTTASIQKLLDGMGVTNCHFSIQPARNIVRLALFKSLKFKARCGSKQNGQIEGMIKLKAKSGELVEIKKLRIILRDVKL